MMNDVTRKYIEALEEHIEALDGAWDGYDPLNHVEMAERLVAQRKREMNDAEIEEGMMGVIR